MAADYQKLIFSNASKSPYTDMYNAYKKGMEAQRAKDQANWNARKATSVNQQNQVYDQAATQNYINYMQAKKNAPSELNAQNIRGGASESSLIRLGTNYNTNVASNEAARSTALSNLENQYAQEWADYIKAYNNDLSAKQTAYAEKQRDWEQSQLEKNLQYFSSAIKGQYNSKKGYEDLIKQLQKSNDPNRTAKIMLTRQAMNEWLKEQEESSGGGGGGGGGGRRGGGGRSYGGSSGGGSSNSGDYARSIGSTVANAIRTGTSRAFSRGHKVRSSSSRSSRGNSYYTGGWRWRRH